MKHIFLLSLVLFICFGNSPAQAQTAKSPGNILRSNEPDTSKILAMLKLINPINENTPVIEQRLDSLLQEAKDLNFNYGVVRALNTLALLYWVRADFDKVKDCYRQILKYSQNNKYPFGYFCGLQNLGVLFLRLGETDSSASYLLSAEGLFLESFGEGTKAKLFLDLGTLYMDRDELSKCLHYYLGALPFYEEEKDTTTICQLYTNFGLLYNKLEVFDKSIEYYKKAIAMTDSTFMNGYFLTNMLTNIGVLYQSVKKDQKTALFYLKRAEYIAVAFKIQDLLRVTYSNIGDVYYQNNDYKTALDYYNKAYNIIDKDMNKAEYASLLINIGAALHKTGKNDKAKEYVQKGLREAKTAKTLTSESRAYNCLYKIDSAQNNYRSALANINMFIALNDSIRELGSRKKIAELEINFDIAKKEKENQYLKEENNLNVQIIKRQRMILVYGFIITLSFAIVIITIFWSRFHLKRLNKELKLKNHEIEIQQSEIKEQNQTLQELNKTKDVFFGIISHDLRSPFGVFLGFLDILNNDYHEMNEKDRLEIIKILIDTGNNTFLLLENLLDWSLIQRGLITPNPCKTNLFEQAQNVLELLQQKASIKNQTILNNIDKNIFVWADPKTINTILRNISNNALKFTPDGGTIEFSNRYTNGYIETCISDTGIGIPEKFIDQIFKLDSNIKRKGTNQETGTGLGLILCKEFVEMSGGNIYLESEEGKGSKFYFTVPMYSEDLR